MAEPIMLGLVCLRTFPSRNVAEVARAALESHGIAATVSASDAGYDISFASGGAKLLVNEDSADSAEEVLASIQELSEPSGLKVSETRPSAGGRTVIWIGAIFVAAAVVGWLFRG